MLILQEMLNISKSKNVNRRDKTMIQFEAVIGYNPNMPQRQTEFSAGYDIEILKGDTINPKETKVFFEPDSWEVGWLSDDEESRTSKVATAEIKFSSAARPVKVSSHAK